MHKLHSAIEHFLTEVKDLRVCVIGETIIDEFIEVTYEGQSMKSFCPVFRYAEDDSKPNRQMGGAAAIANHLRDFVKSVHLVSNGAEEIVKTRLIDREDHKKHVEINKFDTRKFGPIEIDESAYDVVIIADFGHGFCKELLVNGAYHFMAQTNSNNFGYNRLSKWKTNRKRSACLDLREASLQVNKKADFSLEGAIQELFEYEINAEKLFLTLGRKGSVYFDGKDYVHQTAFAGEVVDTIGAGDTFFAFAALSAVINFADINDVMIVPALAASLSCTWLCNEEAVTREKLTAHANRFISK